MAYLRNNLISRARYAGVGGFTDTVGDIAKGAITFFGAQQRAAGATDALTQANKDLLAAQAAQAGPSTEMIVLGLGVLGVAAFLLLRKKKGA